MTQLTTRRTAGVFACRRRRDHEGMVPGNGNSSRASYPLAGSVQGHLNLLPVRKDS
jgi:hypothetical protein